MMIEEACFRMNGEEEEVSEVFKLSMNKSDSVTHLYLPYVISRWQVSLTNHNMVNFRRTL